MVFNRTRRVLAGLFLILLFGSDAVAAPKRLGPITVLSSNAKVVDIDGRAAVKLELKWQGRPTKRALKVFVDIRDGDGALVVHNEHAPSIPTTRWRGKIRYTRTIKLP